MSNPQKYLVGLFCLVWVSGLFAQSPTVVCRNHSLSEKFRSTSIQRSVNLQHSQTSFAKATLGGTKNIVVNEGFALLPMLLKFQQLVGDTWVNVWVDKAAYETSIVNNLNSKNTFVSHQDRLSDRDQTLQEVGQIMVDKVVPGIEASFGTIFPVDNSISDGVNVYIYDIADNFDQTGGFIGGYFDPNDKFGLTGNKSNAIHMDMYPLNPGGRPGQITVKKGFYQILAHEMQHLVHSQFDEDETLWVNEGLSQLAIYRLFHQVRFSNGDLILNSPNDAPSQVANWLSNPRASLLLSYDEPNFRNGSPSSVELYGITYLYFCYLWELMGGEFNGSNQVTDFEADQLIQQIIKSPLNGRAGIEIILKSKSISFDESFASFFMALFHDGNLGQDSLKFINLASFNSSLASGLLKVNSSLNTQGVLPSYDYFALPFGGDEFSNSVLGANFSPAVYANVFGVPLGHNYTISDLKSMQQVQIDVPKSETRILLGVNTSDQAINYLVSYDSNIQLSGTQLKEETIVQNDVVSGIALNITMLANEIVRKRINNNSNVALAIVNENPDQMAITACVAGVNCLNASKLKISKLQKSQLQISKAVSTTEVALEAQTSYDIYFSNKTSSSLSLSPKVVNNSVGTTVSPSLNTAASSEEFGGSTGGCFLASASFLGKDSYEVNKLSIFRDTILLKSIFGREFVRVYYRYSPAIAKEIQQSSVFSLIGQYLLLPLIFFVSMLKSSFLLMLLMMAFISSSIIKFRQKVV